MIKSGDRVKFLNDVGGGIVTGFIGNNSVKVQTEDGFEIPYPVSKLINVDDPALNKRSAVSENAVAEEKPQPVIQEGSEGKILKGKESPDFYFCFVPGDPGNPLAGNIELFLVNDSNFTLIFRYAYFRNDHYKTVMHGSVEPNSKLSLESIGQADLGELPEYFFQLIYFKDKDKDEEWYQPVSKMIKVNPVKFYKEKSFQSNLFFDRNALIYQITENILNTELGKLTDDDFRRVMQAKEKKPDQKKRPVTKQQEIIEVDLHIHELVDDKAGLSNREILDIQMEKVKSEMDIGIRSRAKRIVFIHGVGQGVLKQEISRLLKKKFPKYYFHDASFKEYGYGATMVILRR